MGWGGWRAKVARCPDAQRWDYCSVGVLLQVLQVEGVVEGHEVRMAGDPPEGHVVL